MAGRSAGLLLYRRDRSGAGADDTGDAVEVLLAHPGGPFWKTKDDGAWTLPKGEYDENEDPLDAAKREFAEETGTPPPADGNYLDLGEIKQKSGKIVHAWAVEGDFDPAVLKSNTFQLEWPPRSGKYINVPEVDRVEWFSIDKAKSKINEGQREFLQRLRAIVK